MPPLRALVAAGHDVAMVVTRPDRRRSRRGGDEPSPVKAAAVELGLPVVHAVDEALECGAELGVVVAFGRLIKPHVLERLPMVNIHFSLLPRWRGAAPVERAILAGDVETGVCLMRLEEGLDTGPVHARRVVTIGEDESAAQLRVRLADLGADLVVEELGRGLGEPEPQAGEPTHAAKLSADDVRLDWHLPAEDIVRRVRVGRAWTTWRERRLLVLAARVVEAGLEPDIPEPGVPEPGVIAGTIVGAGNGRGVQLVEVQPEGKGPQEADAWVRGARPAPGERLGT